MNQLIKNSWRVALVALVSTGTFAGGGYLPKIGPAALRLKPRPPVVDLAKVLPPLRMNDEEPAPEPPLIGETIGPLAPLPRAGDGREMVPAQELQSEPLEQGPSMQAEAAPEQQVPLTPQMFMRFFNQSGNREVVVPAPVEFTPPAPTRGSSATYIVK